MYGKKPWLLERRAFLRLGAGLGLSSLLFGWANPIQAENLSKQRPIINTNVTPRSSARNTLLIMLRGGASHIDTFDIKVGSWTPDKLGVGKNSANELWPVGVMPQLAKQANKFSLVRSLQHTEVVHERAEYYVETGRRLNPGLRAEIPHVGAVVALEQEAKRSNTDIFPGFMFFGTGGYTNNGFLSASFSPFILDNPGEGITNLLPQDGLSAFNRRREALKLLNDVNNGETNASRQSFSVFQDQAEKMMRDPMTAPTFVVSEDDKRRYGNNYFGVSIAAARNVFKANRGTRFIEVDQYGWDNHINIYDDRPFSLPALCRQFDMALSALLDDLSNTPGQDGKTLLDETFIVVTGDFGRTVGQLNTSKGRDHYPYAFSALFAGGGVKGGRIIGSTDDSGAGVLDFGWNKNRPIHLPDIVTTMYSTLGIDWTKTLTNTPSGRVYRYADPAAVGDEDSYEITGLF
ncbi:MAG: DUF1501 domain-containing protein [Blastocatellia bacterium]|nr:DUF1501 domain-containing protein [Blastocatellia bacterium]MBL8192408.1 DUF1501 domain-containing protein [Blastocatellia bacterium]MBN8723539.1 DUF1501 domain-containing protein [Acidobacteriota bacterium]